ncbi:MAG: hypothetical protein HZA14_07415 [Nitrospirae bacterium]|nr:hypothetical protein [Nitrospirota bacterium]
MRVFRCNACGRNLETKAPSCPECGCGDINEFVIRIELCHPAVRHPLSVHKTMVLGRNNFRLYGEEYGFVSEEQFRLVKAEGGWEIEGIAAKNPTIMNGTDITGQGPVPLPDNAVITVGPFKVNVKYVEAKV